MPEIANLALSYAAGALSTLSPCVLPLLPIVLFGVLERHAWGPVVLAAGLATSFAVLGTTIAAVGFNIGLDPAMLRNAIAMLMLAMGVVLLIPALQGDWRRSRLPSQPAARHCSIAFSHPALRGNLCSVVCWAQSGRRVPVQLLEPRSDLQLKATR
ncbi:cytochrome c biogenesis CcdA family protein [Bradyrhizobium sp. RDT10]